MEPSQNLTNVQNETDDIVVAYRYDMLDRIQQYYIDWKALGGVITDDDGVRKIKLDELAAQLKINRHMFYDKTKHIPNLQQLITERRRKLATGARLENVHKVWYLSALKPGAEGFRDRQMYLANFDENFRMPTEKREIEIGNNYAALLAAAAKDGVIDGEVVENAAIDAGTSDSNQSPHP